MHGGPSVPGSVGVGSGGVTCGFLRSRENTTIPPISATPISSATQFSMFPSLRAAARVQELRYRG